ARLAGIVTRPLAKATVDACRACAYALDPRIHAPVALGRDVEKRVGQACTDARHGSTTGAWDDVRRNARGGPHCGLAVGMVPIGERARTRSRRRAPDTLAGGIRRAGRGRA